MAGGEERVRLSKRVFINNIHTYTSKHIAQYLDSCVVGASLIDKADPDSEEEETVQDEPANKSKQGTFQVVGTTSAKSEEQKPSFIAAEYTNLTHEELFHHLMESDVIIYNITEHADQIEEASWAVSALHKEMEAFSGSKMFVLISTVMTWALSKPLDPDDPEIPFTEEDYRRRKAHPNFNDHIALEKLVVKLGKTNPSQFSTYVVASGLQYGMEEQVFHFFFKTSWLGEVPRVPVFGEGSNIIPAIHIKDLAGVVQNIIDHKPKPQYFLAVDDSKNTIEDIVRAVALFGPGKIQKFPKEDVYLTQDLTQTDIDSLFVDLRMEAVFLKENFNIHWVCENGIVENIERVTEEYKLTRGLLPVRICVLGPPAVGKSTVAEKICKHYKLHHVKLKETIAETLANLEAYVRADEGDDENDESLAEAQEFLETLKENMEQNEGRLDDQYIIRIMKDKLMSKPCRNQGFVLDGFPKTYEQAKELFSVDDDDDEVEDVRSKIPPHNKKIIPEFVFSLDATDAFLKKRVLNLPESLVEGTSYSQDKFLHRLVSFRENNSEDETVLNYFDELEILTEHIEITSDDDLEYLLVMEKVIKSVGKPRNYGPSSEEVEQEERRQAEIRLREQAARQAEMERREAEETAQRTQRWEEWSQRLDEVKRQEDELLEDHSVPLRHYLMRDVMPTLTQGLIECCRIRPEDPVDFLAEYLLKNNPQAE
ncbi:LOW QUALITY PROTEIN: adenylate kinase 7 [Colossoma macropomum]|uniref:LOW QUALITY PROTEIN: adenylate kinase 7 n=1 Tax=Colossoma macropomum TaxID=42526 RepID=UPI001864F78F|nr:LOW QUALITY PROTEIN: adenylate kinase 7 [Colossoma macropomum]